RHRRVTCQVRVASKHIPRGWTAKDVVDEVSAAGAKPGSLRFIVGKVELHLRSAVKKEAPRLALVEHQCKRDRGVEIVLQRGVAARRIDIPKELPRPRLFQ